jgi:hypothetical protein
LGNIIEDSFFTNLYEKYGEIVKITGLPGRNNMVVLFDPDEIEKVSIMETIWEV